MKKYVILAIMPCIFQSMLQAEYRFADVDLVIEQHFANLDQQLDNLYEKACIAMHTNTNHHFESIIHALNHEAKKGGNKRIVCIEHIVAIQQALDLLRSAEIKKLSNFSWAVGAKPTIITQEIDPALKIVKKALKDLKVSDSEYSLAFKLAMAALSTAIIGGTAIAGKYRYEAYLDQQAINKINQAVEEYEEPELLNIIARIATHRYFDYKDPLFEEYVKIVRSFINSEKMQNQNKRSKEERLRTLFEATKNAPKNYYNGPRGWVDFEESEVPLGAVAVPLTPTQDGAIAVPINFIPED